MTAAFEWGQELPRLPGSRLQLRWITAVDAAAVFAVFGDAEVMKYWSSPPQETLAAAAEYIEEIHTLFESRQLFQWGIASNETDELFGTCTLCQLDRTHRRAEVGFVLGRSFWGHGLATEALELLIGFAFESLKLHRLEADVDPKNQSSLRLLERQGFRREGYLRERWQLGGAAHDSVALGLLRGEWTKRSPKPSAESTRPG